MAVKYSLAFRASLSPSSLSAAAPARLLQNVWRLNFKGKLAAHRLRNFCGIVS